MTRYYRGVEWSDRASDSRYPLIPLATAQDAQKLFSLPNEFLVAVYLAVPADLLIKPGMVYISRVIHTSSHVAIWISAEIAGAIVTLGRYEFSQAAIGLQINRTGYGLASFTGETAYDDLRGRITIGGLEQLAQQPQGEFHFEYPDAGLEADCIRPSVRHVSALELPNGNDTLRLSGPVRLAAGLNTRLRLEVEEGEPVIYLDALDATNLNEELECDYGVSPPVRRVNGLPGDSQRELTLVGSRCLEIHPLEAELQLRNRCSEPCTSCREAEAIQQLILPFSQQIPSLINMFNRLDATLQQTQMNVMMSRGGQAECDPGPGA